MVAKSQDWRKTDDEQNARKCVKKNVEALFKVAPLYKVCKYKVATVATG